MQRVVMLADCQSFYATVEKVAHPEYANRPVVVAGDPERRSGIVLAACPIAKSFGVTTAETLGEALAKCPQLVVIRPRMQEYIKVSLHITSIYNSFTDLVEPYSIDEQFLDVTGSLHLYGGDVQALAQAIQHEVKLMTGVYIRIGIGSNKVLAKMACDNYAKKNSSGIYMLQQDDLRNTLWSLPVSSMFMVGRRMTRHLNRIGVHTIGELANTPLAVLRRRWGVNGEVLWRFANGIDFSPVSPSTHQTQKQIGHHMTLPRDYVSLQELKVPLQELSDLVCQRARAKGYMGTTVAVTCRGANFDYPTGFHRQLKLEEATYVSTVVFQTVMKLFHQHWDGLPVRSIGVSLAGLVSDQIVQLSLFDQSEKQLALERTTDLIKARYGETAIMRAVSITDPGQARDRANKIGGHYK